MWASWVPGTLFVLPLVAPCGGRASFAHRLCISDGAGREQRVVIHHRNDPRDYNFEDVERAVGFFSVTVLCM